MGECGDLYDFGTVSRSGREIADALFGFAEKTFTARAVEGCMLGGMAPRACDAHFSSRGNELANLTDLTLKVIACGAHD